jgi:uncharacterized protein YxjI
MNPILNKNLFFIKEQVAFLKVSNNYDIFDPETREQLMKCGENLSFGTKVLRNFVNKNILGFNVEVTDMAGNKVCNIKRGFTFLRSVVEVSDENGVVIGKFKQKFLSLGGKFDVLDPSDQVLCTLEGKWTSWDFSFKKDGTEFGKVSKKWAGLGKELFTTADNYMLQIHDIVPPDNSLRTLILAAVLTIDLVLHER